MNRRDFIMSGAAAVGVSACASAQDGKCSVRCSGMPRISPPAEPAALNLCLQWHGIPVADDMNAKLDYLEANGFSAVEIPTGDWLFKKSEAFAKAMKGRKLAIATACGPSDFSYADRARREAEVQKFLPQLEILGGLGSVGMILCPARSKPEMPLQDLRKDFVENTGRRLAEKAAACGTSIVLEPLQRGETPFLRQVADGAKMAQEMGPGAKVMGDFWHMSKEETSFMGAFISAGPLLAHVHIASLRRRKYPGSDGDADVYTDGFKGLKLIGYRGAVSMEAGPPPKGTDAKGKPILPDLAERHVLLTKMCALLKRQWEEA